MLDEEHEFDESELAPPKPYTPERAAEIAELMGEIAKSYSDILSMD